MKFNIKKDGINLLVAARRAGYSPQKTTEAGEAAFIRPIQRDFPRFHLYIREGIEEFNFNLHLDQKKPSYGRETAHSGEYEGELVTEESARIRQILTKTEIKPQLVIQESPQELFSQKEQPSKLGSLFKKILGK